MMLCFLHRPARGSVAGVRVLRGASFLASVQFLHYRAALVHEVGASRDRFPPTYANDTGILHIPKRSYSSQGPPVQTDLKSDPLRILFCGTDEFSCAHLDALHSEAQRGSALIQSIDVVVRPPKRTGRRYKSVTEAPLSQLATKLGYPVHERETFTGWSPPPYINLIIAVSFGLFVPPRLLTAARYGGLNVHPSLLPDLRGPAPLQHALLARRPFTGVSLQTLDPVAFDHGVVLAQTQPEEIPIPTICSVQQLLDIVTPVGQQLLISSLRDRVYVPPLQDRGWKSTTAAAAALSADASSSAMTAAALPAPLLHAPKITSSDRQIVSTTAKADIPLRQRVIGPLWFYGIEQPKEKHRQPDGSPPPRPRTKRILVTEIEPVETGSPVPDKRSFASLPYTEQPIDSKHDGGASGDEGPGVFELRPWISDHKGDDALYFSHGDEPGSPSLVFRITKVKVEGEAEKPARAGLARFIRDLSPGEGARS